MSYPQLEVRGQSVPVREPPTQRGTTSPPGLFGGLGTLVRTVRRAAMVQASELGLVASFANTARLHLAGDGPGPKFVALPRLPAHLAPSMRPVLLVHGFGGTKSSWYFIARTLAAKGLTVDAIAYTPFGTSVEELAGRLAIEVERMLAQTGADKVHLIGHSLGGVVIAQALASGRLTGMVDTIVTLGAPFGGSPWANLAPFGGILPALRDGSQLLRRLASAPLPEGVRWLAITATLDMVVPGGRSVPAHSEVETVTIGGVGHLGMLVSPKVAGRIAIALSTKHHQANASEARFSSTQ